jgi:hypothetical protein
MQNERHLILKSRPPYWVVLGAFCVFAIVASLYGLFATGQHWYLWVSLVAWSLAAIYTFAPSYLTINSDRDFIETRIWQLTNYDSQSKHGLRNIKSIQLEVHSGGDAPSYYKKYLIFSDGQKIQLPAVKDVETIVAAWYERYLGIHVPIERNGEIKTVSRRTEIILVLVIFCAGVVFIFGDRVWNYYYSDVIIRNEQVICQASDCEVTFRVINRSAIDKRQEFYVGVWPRINSETDSRHHGELGFSQTSVYLRPHEIINCTVQVKLSSPRLPEGEYALVQKAWW